MSELSHSTVGDPHNRTRGSVLTVLKPDEVLVWLIGDIDVSAAPQLDDIAERAPQVATRLTIDGSRVTFCDTTVLRFVSRVTGSMQVAVRRPSRLFADILAFSGLSVTLLPHRVEGDQP